MPDPHGSTLTQGGYKNNFNSQVLFFPPGDLWLGSNFYTNSDLNADLSDNVIKGNGLPSLAHQLITAELNVFYGAAVPTSVGLAIVTANNLIATLGSTKIPPASSIESILDSFNSSGECN